MMVGLFKAVIADIEDPVYKAFLDSHGVLDPISSSNVVVSTGQSYFQ